MDECFKCKITSEKTILMDAITSKGIKKICQKCSRQEKIPLIRKPDLTEPETESQPSVYERMSRMSGFVKKREVSYEVAKQDQNLRELVDKNFRSDFKKAESHKDLIENFHWILMRARRLRKLTKEQLALKINEPTEAIKMAEKGVLPRDYLTFIKKLERVLGAKLTKTQQKEKEKIEVVPADVLGKPQGLFKETTSKVVTISDLQNVQNKENSPEFIEIEEENSISPQTPQKKFTGLKNFFKRKEKKKQEEFPEEEEDISSEEIDRILYGK